MQGFHLGYSLFEHRRQTQLSLLEHTYKKNAMLNPPLATPSNRVLVSPKHVWKGSIMAMGVSKEMLEDSRYDRVTTWHVPLSENWLFVLLYSQVSWTLFPCIL